MYYDNDTDSYRPPKIADNQRVEEYEHIICLKRGEILKIGADADLVFLGTECTWGEQARFALHAPDNVSILRLELFARRLQCYKTEIEVNFGDKITIGTDLQLCVLPKIKAKGQVYIGVHSKSHKHIQKSVFNKTNKVE